MFKVYDKDGDGKVTFAEWLKMKEGEMDAARTTREKKWFDLADPLAKYAIVLSIVLAMLDAHAGRRCWI